jgi:hypothetical protein
VRVSRDDALLKVGVTLMALAVALVIAAVVVSVALRSEPAVGLGDLTPKTTIGKLFTVIYIFAGLSIILGFIDTVAKETIRRQAGRDSSEEGQEDAPAS